VDKAILTLEKEAKRIAQMKSWSDTIQSHGGKLLEELRKMTDVLEKQITILRDSVEALKQ
jgi:hypothetical protein